MSAEPALPKPALPERTARVAEIVAAARAVLAAEGVDALTMRRLATQLDIQAPSLYKHLAGKEAIEDLLIAEALVVMGDALHRAVARPGAGVAALLRAYRRVGLDEPHLYRLATGRPIRRDALPEGLEAWAGQPFYLVTGDGSAAQSLFAFAHGMVILELDGRFPPQSTLDRTWAAGAAAFQRVRRSG